MKHPKITSERRSFSDRPSPFSTDAALKLGYYRRPLPFQRYYGWYAARVRGKRRNATEPDEEHPLVKVDPEPEALREARRRWAELLRRILEVEPLECPRCSKEMRIVAFITEPKVIDRILDHFRRTAAARRRYRARHASDRGRPG